MSSVFQKNNVQNIKSNFVHFVKYNKSHNSITKRLQNGYNFKMRRALCKKRSSARRPSSPKNGTSGSLPKSGQVPFRGNFGRRASLGWRPRFKVAYCCNSYCVKCIVYYYLEGIVVIDRGKIFIHPPDKMCPFYCMLICHMKNPFRKLWGLHDGKLGSDYCQ